MMQTTGAFEPGAQIMLRSPTGAETRPGTIRLFDVDVAMITFDDGASETFPSHVLREKLQQGLLLFLAPTRRKPKGRPKISKNDRARIARMDAYLVPLGEEYLPNGKGVRERIISEVSARIGDPKPPGASTLSTWFARWEICGRDTAQLVVKEDRQRHPRTDDEYLQLMEEVIRSHYLTRSQPTVNAVYAIFRARFRERNYVDPCPDVSTFRRFLQRMRQANLALFISKREGPSEARSKLRTAEETIEVEFPLDRVECDTAHFNIGLRNADGFYLGKPSLYLVIDCCARALLGYAIQVSDKPRENSAHVIHALRYAISVKEDAYPMYGLIRTLVTDAGPGYRAEQSTAFFESIAETHITTASRQGWGKAFVERFIETMRDKCFRNLKGYLGKYDPTKYSDDTVAKSAQLTIDEFSELVHHFIVDVYHHTPHKGLRNQTPFEAWQAGIEAMPPLAPSDLSEIKCLRGIKETRKLSRLTGVTFRNERFHSNALVDLFDAICNDQETSVKVEVRGDPMDASAITVVSPVDGSLLDVPNTRKSAGNRAFSDLNCTLHARQDGSSPPVFKPEQPLKKVTGKRRRAGPDVPAAGDSDMTDFEAFLDDDYTVADRMDSSGWNGPIISLDNDEADDDDDDYEVN